MPKTLKTIPTGEGVLAAVLALLPSLIGTVDILPFEGSTLTC